MVGRAAARNWVPSRALICRDGACLAILVAGERPPRPRARPRECVVDWYSFSNPRTTPRGAMRRRLLLHIRRTQGHTRTSRRAARDTTDRGTADLVGGERRDRIPFHAGDDHVWKHCGAHAEIWRWRRRHDVPRDLGVVLDVVDCHKAGPVQVACVSSSSSSEPEDRDSDLC